MGSFMLYPIIMVHKLRVASSGTLMLRFRIIYVFVSPLEHCYTASHFPRLLRRFWTGSLACMLACAPLSPVPVLQMSMKDHSKYTHKCFLVGGWMGWLGPGIRSGESTRGRLASLVSSLAEKNGCISCCSWCAVRGLICSESTRPRLRLVLSASGSEPRLSVTGVVSSLGGCCLVSSPCSRLGCLNIRYESLRQNIVNIHSQILIMTLRRMTIIMTWIRTRTQIVTEQVRIPKREIVNSTLERSLNI